MTQGFGGSTVLRRLEVHARERPRKPFAVLYQGESFRVLTYADLQAGALRWADRFAALSPAPGSTVFLVLRHGEHAYTAFLGAMWAGLVPAMLPPPSPKQDPEAFWRAQRALFARSRPAAAVVGRRDLEAVTQGAEPVGSPCLVAEEDVLLGDLAVLADPPPEAPALLQHSSGTTGLKKAVRLSFEQVDRHVGMVAEPLGFTADDVVASWLPLYHDMGLMAAFLAPLTLGASVIALDPFAWVADPPSLLRAIERHRATLCWLPNFAFAHLTRTREPGVRHDLSSLRALIDCSEPCRPETIESFCEAFCDQGIGADRIACSYGMAEVVFAATQTPLGAPPRALEVDAARLEQDSVIVAPTGGRTHQFLSCGAPLPGVTLRIAATVDGPASPGCIPVGEIEVASPVMFDGYHHGGAEPVDPPTGGWRRTGDIGFLHDGELYVCGRTMERLIVHGRTVYAGDVEAVASAVPGVKAGRAVALGVLDEAAGGEEAWLMLEAERPQTDPAAERDLAKAVRLAVQDALDLTLRGVEIGPPGWLAKSTAGKMSRSENLQKLHRLLAQKPAEDPEYGPPRPAAPPGPPEPPAAETPSPITIVATEAPAHVACTSGAPASVAPAPRAVRAAVMQALAECFGRAGARLSDTDGFGDVAGWDSLGHTVLILRIEALLGVRAPESAAARARTVGGLVEAFAGLNMAAEAEPTLERDAA